MVTSELDFINDWEAADREKPIGPISVEIRLEVDDLANRLAIRLIGEMDRMSHEERDRLSDLLGDFELKPNRTMRAGQAHRAFAHVGFLYVMAMRTARNQRKDK